MQLGINLTWYSAHLLLTNAVGTLHFFVSSAFKPHLRFEKMHTSLLCPILQPIAPFDEPSFRAALNCSCYFLLLFTVCTVNEKMVEFYHFSWRDLFITLVSFFLHISRFSSHQFWNLFSISFWVNISLCKRMRVCCPLRTMGKFGYSLSRSKIQIEPVTTRGINSSLDDGRYFPFLTFISISYALSFTISHKPEESCESRVDINFEYFS